MGLWRNRRDALVLGTRFGNDNVGSNPTRPTRWCESSTGPHDGEYHAGSAP